LNLSESIKAESRRLGFSLCGITRARPLEDLRSFYTGFVSTGIEEPLDYLQTNAEKRLDPSLLLPGIRSVVAVLMNYYPPEPIPAEDNYIIAKYACGGDYHPLMKDRMAALAAYTTSLSTGTLSRAFVDSGPVLEKAWAQRCGLGWQGKNTLIINKKEGSFFFIGIILTTLVLEYDPPGADHCGECDRCIKACPTGALDTPYQLNIRKCISFHTIETKGEIPQEIKRKLRGRIYGCDTCQDVCPFNRFATPAADPAFAPSEELKALRKKDWENLTQEQFDRIFRNSSVKRTGYDKLIRNIIDSQRSY
jgi:epoxyqueuosine reductase